jgi:hypothetical protein
MALITRSGAERHASDVHIDPVFVVIAPGAPSAPPSGVHGAIGAILSADPGASGRWHAP